MESYHDGQISKTMKNTMASVQAAETQSKGLFHPLPKQIYMQNCAKNYDNVFWLPKF